MIGTTENVPVQDGLLHLPAATLSREFGEVDEKSSTEARDPEPRFFWWRLILSLLSYASRWRRELRWNERRSLGASWRS